MPNLPRLAVGSTSQNDQHQPILWGLIDCLAKVDTKVQLFRSQARFPRFDGATSITGESPRHLDSWLMSPDTCREVFANGMRASDMGIVEGHFDLPIGRAPALGGRLDDLCHTLNLPRICVVDASKLRQCVHQPRPQHIDGILLDCVAEGDYSRLQTSLEALWGVPVLGGLGELPGVRAVIDHLPSGGRPSKELCRRLGDELRGSLQLHRIAEIAKRPDYPQFEDRLFCDPEIVDGTIIAVAYDEAFHHYFPDALDLLELQGARIRDFSPLRDERLPPDAQLVLLGGGHPEYFAQQLACNHCMIMALRRHFCRGRRVYAEDGGAAYLCRQMALPDGRRLPMVGLLPAVAWQDPNPEPVRPVELTLTDGSWLGEDADRVRGYLNSGWVLQPTGAMDNSCVVQPRHHEDLIVRHGTIGSRIHLNLAAQPQLLHSFLQPRSLELVTA
jgi:cobyrinic acid a,c-diamide synthase